MNYILPHNIQNSAAKSPNHIAFKFGNETVSYEQLVQKSNALAHCLGKLGIKKGDRVGIYMNRCLETCIAVYGIMSAGAVYVPLNIQAPSQRINFVIKDCGIRVLLSNQSKGLQSILTTDANIDTVIGVTAKFEDIDTISWEEVYQESTQNVDLNILENDLAYIMYTSGTTGQPKGIMHTHYSGLSYAKLSTDLFKVTPDDILANHAALHFDISTMGYFTMPYAGGTTVIIPDIHTKLPASLSQLIQDEKISIWYSVPLALTQLLQYGALKDRNLSNLKWVLFGGEPFPMKNAMALQAMWPQATLSNIYGPAEVNQCTYYHLNKDTSKETSIPLGQVWNNTEIMIIDEQDNEVKIGDIGELLVRSATRMKGYWGQSQLTKNSLFNAEKIKGLEEIYYRTGDLVLMREDGNLMFMGRKDRQIKSRGYRVELDEIEAVLLGHEQIKEVAIYAKKIDDINQIEAFIIADEALTKKEVINFSSSLLPSYAVPEKINFTDNIPRTDAGKINYKELEETER